MYLLRLALISLLNRRGTAVLTVFAIALSTALLLTVERIRVETRSSFASTISGTDLVVGARSGAINLLLYSVFRIGNATNNIHWQSFQRFAEHPQVDWAIPLSLGDSHRGYRVLGTDQTYFRHYRYGDHRLLQLQQGITFTGDPFEVVLGATVADKLNYRLGQQIVLSHGVSRISLLDHDDYPFTVTGILAPTGTPVDRTVHIPLEGMEALHVDWKNGTPSRNQGLSTDQLKAMDLQPEAITAFLLGLKNRISTFSLQREINQYAQEPLLAVLPGVALQELWGLVGNAEKALLLVALCVVFVGLIGMLTAILASLNERRREMAILRSVGARPVHIFSLLLFEACALASTGIVVGLALSYVALLAGRNYAQSQYGLFLSIHWPSTYEFGLLAVILACAAIAGCLPAWRAYRQSLSDGLNTHL